jgi:hypothetical protein
VPADVEEAVVRAVARADVEDVPAVREVVDAGLDVVREHQEVDVAEAAREAVGLDEVVELGRLLRLREAVRDGFRPVREGTPGDRGRERVRVGHRSGERLLVLDEVVTRVVVLRVGRVDVGDPPAVGGDVREVALDQRVVVRRDRGARRLPVDDVRRVRAEHEIAAVIRHVAGGIGAGQEHLVLELVAEPSANDGSRVA